MDQLLKFLITQIVDENEAVSINQTVDQDGTVILTVTVAPEDMGRIIGKSGKIISAIRELVRVKAAKMNRRVRVVLAEPATQTNFPSPLQSEAQPEDKS